MRGILNPPSQRRSLTAHMRAPVAITGVGAVTPIGVGAKASFDAWVGGHSGIVDGIASCNGFQPEDFLSAKEIRRTDRFTQLAVCAADEALTMANWGSEGRWTDLPYPAHKIGCVIGTCTGGVTTLEEQQERFRVGGPRSVRPLTIPVVMGNSAAGTITMRFGLHGYSAAVSSACATGADAVATGCRLIRSGELDAVVVGGAEAALTPFTIAAFDATGATSKLGVSRPFDARRDGFVMGEGAGILVLERMQPAMRVAPLAMLAGVGTSSDAFHLTAPDPAGRGAASAITTALADACAVPGDVSYVSAHGTSSPLNDRSETEALKVALGARATKIPTSSMKSAVGHSLGAAGAVEAVTTVLTLTQLVAPPTLGYEKPEVGLDLNYVGGQAEPLSAGENGRLLALSNSFGFGGHNVVLVFERCPGARRLGAVVDGPA
jgi:3-oxoacyl-[acyl-carrier-protein] synthase II